MYPSFFSTKESHTGPLLVVMAHPDDETINLGGIIAQASSKHIPVHVLCMTDGELGIHSAHSDKKALKRIRKKELLEAMSLLGVQDVDFAHIPDGEVYTHLSRAKNSILRTIRQVRPSAIFTHDPSGKNGHPDHVATSLAITQLYVSDTSKSISYYYVLPFKHNKTTALTITHEECILPFLSIKYTAIHVFQSQIIPEPNHTMKRRFSPAIYTERLHKLRDNFYTFHIHEFRTQYVLLLEALNKTITVSKNL